MNAPIHGYQARATTELAVLQAQVEFQQQD